jgi:hypothetical protein
MGIFSFIKSGAAVVGAGVVLAGAASAQASTIIYSQTFSSTAAGILTGTMPTTDTGSAKWQFAGNTGDDWSASGVAPSTSGGGYSSAAEYLPLTVTAGNTYTLTVTGLSPVSGTTTNWLAVGFFNGTSGNLFGGATQGPFMLLRDTGYIQAFGGPGIDYGASFNSDNGGVGAGSYSLGGTATVTLNATSATTSDWTATFAYNGTTIGSITYNNTSFPPETNIGVGFLSYQSQQGSVGSLTLTETPTPEPASLSLAGLAAGALLLMKKRRSA